MRELSLFTGAGGGLLGTHLLGWTPIGYVEWDDYCQRVLAARIADGYLPVAPIFTDVREFIQSGAAREYRGVADVVTAGFPCTPFSLAGKRAGADDERNMWPTTIECIRQVRPQYAFLENVPGLLSSGYFGTILNDLAESGHSVRWRCLSAAEVGAPHKRDRLWIVAYAEGEQGGRVQQSELPANAGASDQDVPVAESIGCEWKQNTSEQTRWTGPQSVDWWKVEPPLGRVVNGYAGRVAELRAAGNAQVATVAAAAWRLLTEDLI